MDIKEISAYLANNAESVCRMLFTNGKLNGKEFEIGSINGEAGHSLRVHIAADKDQGTWKDFSEGSTLTGGGKNGGDMVDLWAASKRLSIHEALKDIENTFGLKSSAPSNFRGPIGAPVVQETFKEARIINPKPDSEIESWLVQGRDIAKETLDAFGVKSCASFVNKDGKTIPATYYLPSFKNGKLINWKVMSPKDSNGKRHVGQSGGCQKIAFGWQCVDPNARELVICEGEIDAMSWYQMGYSAISLPQGSGCGDKLNFIEYDFDELERFDTFYISMDNDKAGKETIEPLTSRLGKDRCRIVTLPEASSSGHPLKDANDCLCFGITKQEFDTAIARASDAGLNNIGFLSDYMQSAKDLHFGRSEKFKGVPCFLEPNMTFLPGDVTIWTGINGHGKTMVLNQLMIDQIVNSHKKDEGKVIKFGIVSAEMVAEFMIDRIVKQSTGVAQCRSERLFEKSVSFFDGKIFRWNVSGSVDVAELLESYRYLRKKYGVEQFIIDSLACCGLADDDYNGQKKISDMIANFARDEHVHVHLVVHPRKSSSELSIPGKMDVGGSGSITNLASNVITVSRNMEKEMAELSGKEYTGGDEDGFLWITKNRNGHWTGIVKFYYNPLCHQYSARPGFSTHYIEPDEDDILVSGFQRQQPTSTLQIESLSQSELSEDDIAFV